MTWQITFDPCPFLAISPLSQWLPSKQSTEVMTYLISDPNRTYGSSLEERGPNLQHQNLRMLTQREHFGPSKNEVKILHN